MKALVLYHANCLDGFGAAFAAWKKFGYEAEYIAVNYGQEPPPVSGKDVYILDFSYPRETLLKMAAVANTLTVLDHHKTARDDLAGLAFAKFDMEKSGCRLAWEHFHPEVELPAMLFHIEDRDLWEFTSPLTKPFCEALRNTCDMDFEIWDSINESSVSRFRLVDTGSSLLLVFDREVSELLKYAHKTPIALLKEGLACNAPPKYASELGDKLAELSGTYGVVYFYSGETNEWRYSLRSIGGYDVSAIAKQFGGGGHKNAAGFSTKELLKI